ncbi:MAG: pantoate--beta-alanine ligase [Actinomycetota bacterium]
MKIARTVVELRGLVARSGREGRIVGFVPTMGALHEGHLSLIRAARSESDLVVLSIFVNPLQFGPTEDLHEYPRNEPGDLELAEIEKVDVVFLPSLSEMYPAGAETTVRTGRLGEVVEGAARPGHFDGVATVVTKLFNQVEPDKAYFGQKDAQQVAVVKRLVADLGFGIDVVVCPTVRESDGLAMSSRNAYLSEEERVRATVLWRALQRGRAAYQSGFDPDAVERAMAQVIASEEGVSVDYARVVDPETFESPSPGGPALLVIAARVGSTRLIDNLPIKLEPSERKEG